jgi:hypothetical protein
MWKEIQSDYDRVMSTLLSQAIITATSPKLLLLPSEIRGFLRQMRMTLHSTVVQVFECLDLGHLCHPNIPHKEVCVSLTTLGLNQLCAT